MLCSETVALAVWKCTESWYPASSAHNAARSSNCRPQLTTIHCYKYVVCSMRPACLYTKGHALYAKRKFMWRVIETTIMSTAAQHLTSQLEGSVLLLTACLICNMNRNRHLATMCIRKACAVCLPCHVCLYQECCTLAAAQPTLRGICPDLNIP